MTVEQSTTERAYRTVLYYSQNHDQGESIETAIQALLDELRPLCEEYGIDFYEATR